MNENQQSFSLIYRDRFKMKDKKEGLAEPSFLAISYKNGTLWTVSNDTKTVYNLSLNGKIIKDKLFKIHDNHAEGITLDPCAEFLFTVNEKGNEIIKYDVDKQIEIGRVKLAKIDGLAEIDHCFPKGIGNKLFKGIAWNSTTETIFIINETNPRLIVEISPDLELIYGHKVLSPENGFCDPLQTDGAVNFSAVCYDENRDCFWIISHMAKRLFLYDWVQNEVIHHSALRYDKNGKYKEIARATGIAVDPDNNQLYVVSGKDAWLYVFDIRD